MDKVETDMVKFVAKMGSEWAVKSSRRAFGYKLERKDERASDRGRKESRTVPRSARRIETKSCAHRPAPRVVFNIRALREASSAPRLAQAHAAFEPRVLET